MKAARHAARTRRDDFSSRTRSRLALRVAHRCSHPDCRVSTVGPTDSLDGVRSVGRAAHITAAAPGGPRYDAKFTPEQRRSIDNAIWLCANHADLVDGDEKRFPVALLREWKERAERAAREEQGSQLPSPRELAAYKTKVLGENLTGGSVASLLAETSDIARRELEKLDPRLSVGVATQDGTPIFTLQALEDVPLKFVVGPPQAKEWATQFERLLRHGDTLSIDSTTVRVTGSPLTESLFDGWTGKLEISKPPLTEAVLVYSYPPAVVGAARALEVAGEIRGGTESFTFRGQALGGIFSAEYRLPKDHGMSAQADFTHTFDFHFWDGKSLQHLPYFERVASFIAAAACGQPIQIHLEIMGNRIFSGATSSLIQNERIQSIDWLLHYIREARELLRAIGGSVEFWVSQINSEEARAVHELWHLLVNCRNLRGIQLPELTLTMQVLNEQSAAAALVGAIQDATPQIVRVTQQLAHPLSLFGKPVPIGKLTLLYTDARFHLADSTQRIEPGKACSLRVVPSETSKLTTYVDRDASNA